MAMIEIKKYANRRLYNMADSRYITLVDLADMIKDKQQVTITDARSGEDLTATTLLQILIETHNSDAPLLSADVLATMIAYDNTATSAALASHIATAMTHFQADQQNLQDMTQGDKLNEVKSALSSLTKAVAELERSSS